LPSTSGRFFREHVPMTPTSPALSRAAMAPATPLPFKACTPLYNLSLFPHSKTLPGCTFFSLEPIDATAETRRFRRPPLASPPLLCSSLPLSLWCVH
jgi:hypothetical protein